VNYRYLSANSIRTIATSQACHAALPIGDRIMYCTSSVSPSSRLSSLNPRSQNLMHRFSVVSGGCRLDQGRCSTRRFRLSTPSLAWDKKNCDRDELSSSIIGRHLLLLLLFIIIITLLPAVSEREALHHQAYSYKVHTIVLHGCGNGGRVSGECED